MNSRVDVIAGVGLRRCAQESRWPARSDLVQSGSGLVLALFMWGHMFFVSSILISRDAMWTITKFFEGYFFFGRSYPGIVSVVVAAVIALSGRARGARGAQVPDQLSAVQHVPRPHEDDAARRHHALVLAGVHRLRAVLPGHRPPVRDARRGRSASDRSSPRTACGAITTGRSTSCCCSRSSCTAASACTGWP